MSCFPKMCSYLSCAVLLRQSEAGLGQVSEEGLQRRLPLGHRCLAGLNLFTGSVCLLKICSIDLEVI